MAERTCSIDGCGKPRKTRGWCGMHYVRWKRHGSTDLPEPPPPRPCSIDGCDRLVEMPSKGWCRAHYWRWWANGDPGGPKLRRYNAPIVDGQKQCVTCQQWLPVERYGPNRRLSTGLKSSCRECERLAQQEFKRQNPGYFARWAEANPDAASSSVHRRRAARNAVGAENVKRSTVFERDDFTCKLCGEPLQMDAPRYHPWSATIDHIVPLSRGGAHTYSNVQAAHWRCNIAKGNRMRVA